MKNLKTLALSLLIGLTLAGGITYAAWATNVWNPTDDWIADGEVISAQKIAENFEYLYEQVQSNALPDCDDGQSLKRAGGAWACSVSAGQEVFTTTGENIFTVPTGVNAIAVALIGGGGGGGGGDGNYGTCDVPPWIGRDGIPGGNGGVTSFNGVMAAGGRGGSGGTSNSCPARTATAPSAGSGGVLSISGISSYSSHVGLLNLNIYGQGGAPGEHRGYSGAIYATTGSAGEIRYYELSVTPGETISCMVGAGGSVGAGGLNSSANRDYSYYGTGRPGVVGAAGACVIVWNGDL